MTSSRALAPVLVGILLLGAAPVHASHSSGALANVHTIENLGCSPDKWTSPDLQARFWYEGRVVGETSAPHSLVELTGVPASATVAIEVREAEPGGFFFVGTTWIPCDAAPGSDTWVNVTFSSPTRIDSSGTGASAVRFLGAIGPASARHPSTLAPIAEGSGTTYIRFSWSPQPAGEPLDALEFEIVPSDGNGRSVTTTLDPKATTYNATGLLEHGDYDIRLTRQMGVWSVRSAWGHGNTTNIAPPAPTLTADAIVRGTRYSVNAYATDLARVEVHVSEGSDFTPNASTLKATFQAPWNRQLSRTGESGGLTEGVRHEVVAIAYDRAGLSTHSTRLAVVPLAAPTPLNETIPLVATLREGLLVDWNGTNTTGFAAFDVEARRTDAPGESRARTGGSERNLTLTGVWPGATYEVRVLGLDAEGGAVASRWTNATWARGNTTPDLSLTLSPTPARPGQTVHANVSALDPDGDIPRLTLDWGDGVFEPLTLHAQHEYAKPGSYLVTLRARDPYAGETTLTRALEVFEPPVPTAFLSLSATNITLGTRVYADATDSHDPTGQGLRYQIDWGDGHTAPSSSASHVYADAGRYHVALTVTDSTGASDSVVRVLTVRGTAGDAPSSEPQESEPHPDAGETPGETAGEAPAPELGGSDGRPAGTVETVRTDPPQGGKTQAEPGKTVPALGAAAVLTGLVMAVLLARRRN